MQTVQPSTMITCETPEQVLSAIQDHGSVLVDISTEYCHPCKLLSTELEKVSSRHENVIVVKIDKDVVKKYGIKKWKMKVPSLLTALELPGVPVLVFFKEGKIINERLDGEETCNGLYFGLVKYMTIVNTLKRFGMA